MVEKYSDLATVVSSDDSECDSEGFKMKKKKGKKHRLSITPTRDSFGKKANMAKSPQYSPEDFLKKRI